MRNNKKSKNIIKIVVCVILCLVILWQFSYPVPFGGIRNFFWEMKHKETEKTQIQVEGSGFLDEEHMVVKYGEDVYCTVDDGYGETYICRIDQEGTEYPIEGMDNYINEDMAFSWAVASGDYLILNMRTGYTRLEMQRQFILK